jgi:hypothetical protein
MTLGKVLVASISMEPELRNKTSSIQLLDYDTENLDEA